MAKKIYYEKRGRRYVPVMEYDNDFIDAFPKGAHMVICNPGGSSRRYNVNPAFGPMIAAGRYAEDKMLDAIRKISEARPKRKALTDKQRQAWQTMKEAFGDDMFSYSYASNVEIVEAGIKAMTEEANKLLTHPAVKDQYEKFLMTCELVKDDVR